MGFTEPASPPPLLCQAGLGTGDTGPVRRGPEITRGVNGGSGGEGAQEEGLCPPKPCGKSCQGEGGHSNTVRGPTRSEGSSQPEARTQETPGGKIGSRPLAEALVSFSPL